MHSYFIEHRDYFWHWDHEDEHFGYIVLQGGHVLMHREELISILEPLADFGLPQLGSLLHVLIALSNTIDEDVFHKHLNQIPKLSELTKDLGEEQTLNSQEVLSALHNLPAAWRHGEQRTHLLAKLFEDNHNKLGKRQSRLAVESAGSDIRRTYHHFAVISVTVKVISKDLRPIALLKRKFKSLQELLALLSDEIPAISLNQSLEEEFQNDNPSKELSLVDALLLDRNTYRIGSLIKHIWSGMNIPMNLGNTSSQPLGGISDLHNKGNLSSLLASEYMHDEDVFLSRILNNEALYIERETPPQNQGANRVLLVDHSIRSWGVPKTLAHAMAVAIAAHPRSDYETEGYIVGGSHCKPFNVFDVPSIVEVQFELSGSLHAYGGLKRYYEDFHVAGTEVFFITTARGFDYIAPHLERLPLDYLITTNTSGDIHIERLSKSNSKKLKQLFLPYQELWQKGQRRSTNQKKSNSKSTLNNQKLGSTGKLSPYLLEPIKISEIATASLGQSDYVIQNGHLYEFIDNQHALKPIKENVSNYRDSHFILTQFDENESMVLHELSASAKAYITTNIDTGDTKHYTLDNAPDEPIQRFFYGNGSLYVIWGSQYYTLQQGSLRKLTGLRSILEYAANHEVKQERLIKDIKRAAKNYTVFSNINEIEIIKNSNQFYLRLDNRYLEYGQFLDWNKNRWMKNPEYYNCAKQQQLYLKRVNTDNIVGLKELLDKSLNDIAQLQSNLPYKIGEVMNEQQCEELKLKLEKQGHVCFTKTEYFLLTNGNRIFIQGYQLYFQNEHRPKNSFYLTLVLNHAVGLASAKEVTGPSIFERKGIGQKRKPNLDFKYFYFKTFVHKCNS